MLGQAPGYKFLGSVMQPASCATRCLGPLPRQHQQLQWRQHRHQPKLAAVQQHMKPQFASKRILHIAAAQPSGDERQDSQEGNVTLSKLAVLAAAAAIFLGGYTTGTGSSGTGMLGDMRSAEEQRQELSAPATGNVPPTPVSLTAPSQAAKKTIVAAQPVEAAAGDLSTVSVFQASSTSVVNVTDIRAMQKSYSMDAERTPAGSGSGSGRDRQGVVGTDYHVIKGASEVKVTLPDKSTYSATLLGFDPDKSVAVLQLDVPQEKQPASSSSDQDDRPVIAALILVTIYMWLYVIIFR